MRRIASTVALSLAVAAVAQAQAAPIQHGDVAAVTVPSTTYTAGRQAWVYTPAGYPASCKSSCNLMLVFDGAMYMGALSLPQVLDSLTVAARTPPTVAIMFDNGAPPGRINDLANSERFAAFVASELLPWTHTHYQVTRDARHTIVAGASAGGLGAAYIAFRYPALFGNVLSQSGAFWRGSEASNGEPYEWLTTQYASAPKSDIHFFIDVGSRESMGVLGGAAPSLLDANRRLRDVLAKKGYAVEYFEVPNGGHSTESWRARLPTGIVTLAPR